LSPSNTQTHRYGVNASLIWDITDTGTFCKLSYAWDHAKVRQTGEYGQLMANGYPYRVFRRPVRLRHAYSWQPMAPSSRSAIVTPVAGAEPGECRIYRQNSSMMRCCVDIGFRDPFLHTPAPPKLPIPARRRMCTAPPPPRSPRRNQAAAIRCCLSPSNTSYNKLLPNVGVTWHLDDASQLFAD